MGSALSTDSRPVAGNRISSEPKRSALSDNIPGALIAGKYRLRSPLGEGGMGSVWLAQNVDLDTPVALKRILPGLQNDQTARRLSIEAHVGAALRHPSIVRVLDFGHTEGGDAFIVMEDLQGVSLDHLVTRRGRLDAIEAVQLVLPIIDALCHAHACGVVHRDIKPDNIFLDRIGSETHPKLLDFGIAKLTHGSSPDHTLGGRVFGSPAYMAPEQARGEVDVDHRADIWGTCVVLYEAISGTSAFGGRGDTTPRNAMVDELPPLRGGDAGEDALWQILRRGLEKDRARRFRTMRELGDALARWLTDQGETEDLHGSCLSHTWGPSTDGDTAPASSIRRGTELPLRPRPAEPPAPPSGAPRGRPSRLAMAVAVVALCLPSDTRSGHPTENPELLQTVTTTTVAVVVAPSRPTVEEPRSEPTPTASRHVIALELPVQRPAVEAK